MPSSRLGVIVVSEDVGAALDDRCPGIVVREPGACEAMALDFGGVVRRVPRVVARPREVAEVAEVLSIARERGIGVVARGSGHSQSGQGLSDGGILLDMRGLGRVLSIDRDAALVTAEGGTVWRQVVDGARAIGMMPVAPTHVTDPTMAGTLSMAGVGAQSWRYGAQINNVRWLDVATMDGRITRCSPTDSPELFDAVRGGLGQCGVIVRVGYPLRRTKSHLRCHHLLYDDGASFVRDVMRATASDRADYLTGFFVREPGRWRLSLVVGIEMDDGGAADDAALDELAPAATMPFRDTPLWNDEAAPDHPFFRRYEGAPPGTIHPWVEHLHAAESAAAAIDDVLERWPFLLGMGRNMIILVGRRGIAAPLFAVPEGSGVLFGLGLFPELPAAAAGAALPLLDAYARRGIEIGGKRYLSGYLGNLGLEDWRRHFDRAWNGFVEAKHRHDPAGLLNARTVVWA